MRIAGAMLLLSLATLAWGAIKMAQPFSDGMVLQREMKVPIFGTAAPNEPITVTFREQVVKTTADANGAWRLDLAPLTPGGPWPMTIAGTNTINYPGVYVGDVWLCYGQSNIQWEVKRCNTTEDAMQQATDQIRLLHVHRPWVPAAGEPLANFSAVSFYFAVRLREYLKIPIGLIYGAEGGTEASCWLSNEALKSTGYTPVGWDSLYYNDRVKTVLPYACKGALWYQGESNVGRDRTYLSLMATLVQSWRQEWGQGDFPFLTVQLARIGNAPKTPAPNPTEGWALIRDAQTRLLAEVPNTGMVVCYDTSDGDIHPPNKKDVGARLALLARAMVYGDPTAQAAQSPLFQSATRQGDTVTVRFSHVESGLVAKDAPDGAVKDLFLISEDGTVKPAPARLAGGTLTIDLAGEQALPSLYYAWNNYPMGNLYNGAGLPVSPFRLQTLRFQPDRCAGTTVILGSNQPLDPAMVKKLAAFRIAGRQVVAAELRDNRRALCLTVDRPWTIDETVQVSFPGLTDWDGQSPIPALTYQAQPGRLLTGDLLLELLVGEQRKEIDPATVLEQDLLDAKTVRPASAAGWRYVASDTGRFDMLRAFPGKNANTVAFAHAYLYADTDRTVRVQVGSKDGIRVMVNGETLLRKAVTRGLRVDEDVIPNVRLHKGWNTLLLEVSLVTGHWDVCARILDEAGHPPTGISYQAERPDGI